MQFPKQRWPMPRQAEDIIRNGPRLPRGESLERQSPLRCSYSGDVREGTDGLRHHNKRTVALTGVAWLRRQNHTPEEAYAALMDPGAASGQWLRRQHDPESEFRKLWAEVDPNLKPCLPVEEQQRRIRVILTENRGRQMSQNRLISLVGHFWRGHVIANLRDLVRRGLVTCEVTMHGTKPYYDFQLADTDEDYIVATYEIRCDLAETIRIRKGEQARCHRLARREEQINRHLVQGVHRTTAIKRARRMENDIRDAEEARRSECTPSPWRRPESVRPEGARPKASRTVRPCPNRPGQQVAPAHELSDREIDWIWLGMHDDPDLPVFEPVRLPDREVLALIGEFESEVDRMLVEMLGEIQQPELAPTRQTSRLPEISGPTAPMYRQMSLGL